MKAALKRTGVIIAGYLAAVLVIWFYDTFLERVKEQAMFVFLLASLISALLIGFLNSHFKLGKPWIPMIFTPGSFLFLFGLAAAVSNGPELGLLVFCVLVPSIAGLLAGVGLGKIRK